MSENTSTEEKLVAAEVEIVEGEEKNVTLPFDLDLVRKYPKANRRLALEVAEYSAFDMNHTPEHQIHTTFISPHGIEFQGSKQYEDGALLKIQISLPNYWDFKQKFVEYSRVDRPATFKLLARVVRTEVVGKRGRKKIVVAKTVNIDEIDEKILKSFLEE